MTTKTLASAGQSKYTSGYNNHASPTTGVTFVNRGTIGVSATQWGAIIYGTGNTFQNYGIITEPAATTPPAAAVGFANANNVLYNHQGATLGSAYEFAFYTANNPAARADNCTLINAGVMLGATSRYAINMENSGVVTNLSTGTITHGISFYNGYTNSGATATSNVTVVNSGQIIGTSNPTYKYSAIFARNGGVVTNLAGTIAASTGVYGIKFGNANALNVPSTVTNAATISGGSGGDAILMASVTGNRVIDKSGGVFIGTVNGGTTATMELASTASAGVLTATASQFTNFSNLIIDAGARWTINGDGGLSTEFPKISGFTIGDTISLTGLSSTPTTFASSVGTVSGTIQTSVTIKNGGSGLETLTLLGSIASNLFSFVAGATSTLTVVPPPPSVTKSLVSDTGTSGSDKITSNDALTGGGDPNAVVTLKEGATTLGTATANSGGTWSFTPSPALAEGLNTVVASETNAGGTGSASLTFTMDTTSPAVTAALANDTGSSGSDKNTSNDALTGGGDANAVVTLKQGVTTLGTTTANGAGTWSFTPSPALSQGSNTVVASETDAAGNTGSASLTFTLDTTAPLVSEALVADTGTSGSDKITSNDQLTGGGDANAVVTLKQGITTLGTATANAGGTWTFTPSPALAQGANTVVASETDLAGNTGSASLTFTYDTTPPAVTEALANDTGTSPSDGITSNDAVTGGGDANAVVTIKEGATTLGTTTANGAGTWSFSGYSPALANSAHTVVVSETDAAGNSGSASLTFTLDTAPPSVNSIHTVGSSPNKGGTEQFTVNFSETVSGVDTSDFTLADTGDVTGTISSVSAGGGSSVTVTVTGATGTGTMGLNLNSTGTGITDLAGNAISGGFTGGDTYSISPSACFVTGTRIATADGPRAVEALRIGDLVVTLAGEARPIRWIGQRTVEPRRHPFPDQIGPLRIAPDTFGPGQPVQALFVSPDHGIRVPDVDHGAAVLVPAGLLAEGDGIASVDLGRVTYWHVELDTHDIILAEGLPVESYLDTGTRDNFAETGTLMRLYPDFSPPANGMLWEADGCLRLVLTGPLLAAARQRVAETAARDPAIAVSG